jgi:hypothetical protein
MHLSNVELIVLWNHHQTLIEREKEIEDVLCAPLEERRWKKLQDPAATIGNSPAPNPPPPIQLHRDQSPPSSPVGCPPHRIAATLQRAHRVSDHPPSPEDHQPIIPRLHRRSSFF